MWCIYSLFMLLVSSVCYANPPDSWVDQIVDVTNASQRCRVRNCTCSVRPGPRPDNPTRLVETERRFEVYFADIDMTPITENPAEDDRSEATQAVCGKLYRELWSDDVSYGSGAQDIDDYAERFSMLH